MPDNESRDTLGQGRRWIDRFVRPPVSRPRARPVGRATRLAGRTTRRGRRPACRSSRSRSRVTLTPITHFPCPPPECRHRRHRDRRRRRRTARISAISIVDCTPRARVPSDVCFVVVRASFRFVASLRRAPLLCPAARSVRLLRRPVLCVPSATVLDRLFRPSRSARKRTCFGQRPLRSSHVASARRRHRHSDMRRETAADDVPNCCCPGGRDAMR